MAADKQVIIVGGGHNGLVAAGYLARAGFDLQVLERRDLVGGAAVTEEWFPGYRLSTCSYVCHILQKKVIDDLEITVEIADGVKVRVQRGLISTVLSKTEPVKGDKKSESSGDSEKFGGVSGILGMLFGGKK